MISTLELMVRELAANDLRCPYNEEACRSMPIDRKYMRYSGYGKPAAAILSALRAAGYAVVPVEPTSTMMECAVLRHYNKGSLADVWAAMIAAAQEPQE